MIRLFQRCRKIFSKHLLDASIVPMNKINNHEIKKNFIKKIVGIVCVAFGRAVSIHFILIRSVGRFGFGFGRMYGQNDGI